MSQPIRSAAASIAGHHRAINEDAWGTDEHARVFVVADGCGGASSAAADIVVETLLAPVPSQRMDPLAAAVELANQRILHAAVGDKNAMACAAAAVRFDLPSIAITHVGDCRVYRLRKGQLKQLTLDHDLKLEVLRDARSYAQVNLDDHATVITRALGTTPSIDIDVQYRHTQPGDLYLLCSDGLWRQLSDVAIESTISTEHSLADRCQALVSAADGASGYDNVTVVLVQLD
jgi:protein phosphatase